MEERFLHSVALPRACEMLCQRREMAVSTNNGLVNAPIHNLLIGTQPAYAVFHPRQLKNRSHLAEVVRSKPGRRIYGENATYPPILAILGLFAYPTPRG